MKKFLNIFLFVFLVLCCFLIIIYSQKYDVLTDHDLVFSYGRDFLFPEHGRYIATYMNNLLTEILPEYLNIHPNDFQQIFVIPLKAVCTILLCILLANSAFIFSKRKSFLENFNPAIIVVYSTIFLSLYNENFISHDEYKFLHIFENTVFLEYIMSIPIFVLFFSIFTYLYIYQDKITNINKKELSAFLILTFALGITVEPINVPVFAILVILLLFNYLTKRSIIPDNPLNDNVFSFFSKVFAVYSVSTFLYYFTTVIHWHHHDVFNCSFDDYKTYIVTYFVPYIKDYFSYFISKESIMLLPILIILAVLFFNKKHYDNTSKNRFIFFLIINMTIFLIFYFSLFLLKFLNSEFYIHLNKWIYMYKLIILFWLTLSIGYLIDMNKAINEKYSQIIKILLCVFVLIVFCKSLILNFPNNIKNMIKYQKTIRTAAYIAEKKLVSEKTDEVFLPEKYKDIYSGILWINDQDYYCSFTVYVHNVHPNINNNYNISYKDYSDEAFLSKKEIQELKFQNLLTSKMYRHKKDIKNCY